MDGRASVLFNARLIKPCFIRRFLRRLNTLPNLLIIKYNLFTLSKVEEMVKIKSPKGRPYYVYTYFDVRQGKEGNPIYVGFSKFEEGKRTRVLEHWRTACTAGNCRNALLTNVLLKIQALGLAPRIEIMMWFKEELRARKYEQSLIKRYGRRVLSKGSLCNLTDGGDGPGQRGYIFTPEQKVLKSVQAKEQFRKPEQVELQRIAGKKKWQTEEYRKRCTEAIICRSKGEKYRENLRQKAKAQWTAEARAEKSAVQRTSEFRTRKAAYWTEERRLAHSKKMQEVRAASQSWPKAKERKTPKKRNEWVGNAKIDEWGVRFIRFWSNKGHSQVEIARNFVITQAQVSNIVLGTSWKHVA